MGDCEFINKCPFFHDMLDDKPESIDEMKSSFCRGNNLNCARYMVANALGKEKMPPNLYPHEKARAFAVIAQEG